jgi:pyruvate/2-oxoglutarate dehydrogenase complex dihydrolipoamide acyltransferase (E2) component
MTIDIRMPEIAADVTEADVLAWLVAPGEAVQAGDVLLEIETDKSTVEIESPATGVLSEILVGDDTQGVAVGTLLARLQPTDATTAQSREATQATEQPSARTIAGQSPRAIVPVPMIAIRTSATAASSSFTARGRVSAASAGGASTSGSATPTPSGRTGTGAATTG